MSLMNDAMSLMDDAMNLMTMSLLTLHCPQCREERPFERPHHPAECGDLADSPDGLCPELACTECGAALLVGFAAPIPVSARPGSEGRPHTPVRAA